MKRLAPGILSEILPVCLVLGAIGGTFASVVAVHQRSMERTRTVTLPRPAPVVELPAAPPPVPADPAPSPAAVVVVPPPPSAPPQPPPEDPTRKALATIASELATQRAAAAEADRRSRSLMKARLAAEVEARRWVRREALVRSQAAELTEKAETLEREVDALALERDALAMQVSESKTELEKARRNGGGYAVLPHRGPNGTWQRPVVIECRDGLAVLQPRGLSFTMLDLSGLLGVRSSPLVAAVAQEMIRVQEVTSPDGSPVVPYIYFIVRPDGIRPFYEARARLEPLGIAFGYELVDKDWDIAFPDADTWDAEGITRPKHLPGGGASFAWPADRTDAQKGRESNPFLWPSTRSAPERGGQVLLEDFDRLNPSRDRNGTTPRGSAGAHGTTEPPVGGGGGTETSEPGVQLPLRGGRPNLPLGEVGEGVLSPGRVTNPGLHSPGNGTGLMERPGGLYPGNSPSNRTGRPIEGDANGGGLSPVGPEGLPRFDAVGTGHAGAGRGPLQPGSGGGRLSDGARPGLSSGNLGGEGAPGVPPVVNALSPEVAGRLASSGISPQVLGLLARAAEKEGRVPTAPDGRVRINSAQLAASDSDDEGPDTTQGEPSPSAGSVSDGAQGPPAQGGSGSTTTSRGGLSRNPGAGAPSGSLLDSPPTTGSAGGGGSVSPSGRPRPVGPGGIGDRSGPTGPNGRAVRGGTDFSPSTVVEAPLELTVVCGPDGVVLHPGGYRISLEALKKEKGLELDLRTIVRNHALIDISVRPLPRVEYLVEPGGEGTYLEARKQMVLSGLDWPVTIRSSTGGLRSHFAREPF